MEMDLRVRGEQVFIQYEVGGWECVRRPGRVAKRTQNVENVGVTNQKVAQLRVGQRAQRDEWRAIACR